MYIEGCVTLPDPENGDVHINGVMVGDLYIIGSQATYVCDKGFELYPSGITYRNCEHGFGVDGNYWSNDAPTCIPVCKYDLISLFGLSGLYIKLLSCQPRVTVTSCFVYKVIRNYNR